MIKSVATTKVDLSDGKYNAIWSAYRLEILDIDKSIIATVKTHIGVKGLNCPEVVSITDGVVDIL